MLLEVLQIDTLYIEYDKEYVDHQSYKAEEYFHKLLKSVATLVNLIEVYVVMDRQCILEEKDSPVDKGKESWELLERDAILVTNQIIQEAGINEKRTN